MTGRLEGKVCIVTGAAQGIGAAYARALAGEGADVAIVDLTRIDQAAVERGVEAIASLGRRSLAIKADVSDPVQMADMGRRVVDELGRVDCLVNNAGLMFDQLTASWDDFLAVNFMGVDQRLERGDPVLLGAAQRLDREHLLDRGVPAAVPVAARPCPTTRPAPTIRPEGYGMTKWMLIHQTRSMAMLLGQRGIRVERGVPRHHDVAGGQGGGARADRGDADPGLACSAPRSSPTT